MLRVETQGPVLFVTLDRPEVRNALNDELIAKLTETMTSLPRAIRAVVIQGEGKGFCAGGDLEWMRKAANYTEEENFQDAMKVAGLFQSVALCPAPVIASVHGAAFGGGSGLVASVDVAVAAPDAKFSFSEVKLGLIPATISSFVIDKIGPGHTKALFTTGEAFDAEYALRIGLVHEVAEDRKAAVDRKLAAILASGPEAVAASKRIVLERGISLEECARRLAKARAGAEGREGVGAFLEKRKASFVTEWPQS